MPIKQVEMNKIKNFNEIVYNDLNKILRVLNKKFNLKLYSIVFNSSNKKYCTSIRIKKTVASDHNRKFDINQEEMNNLKTVFNELNINYRFEDDKFYEEIEVDKFYEEVEEYFNKDIRQKYNNSIEKPTYSESKAITDSNIVNIIDDVKRLLFINFFCVQINSKKFKIVYVLEIGNLDMKTLDIFYKDSYFSYLKLILVHYFCDFYNLDDNQTLVFGSNIENKYNEDYINFVRRVARAFFGKAKNYIEDKGDIKDYIEDKGCVKDRYAINVSDFKNKYCISDLIEKINNISDKTYENLNPFGSMLLLNKDVLKQNNEVEYTIKFVDDNKIELDNSKMIRKLLEMTNKENGLYLISDCENILGLGKVKWDQLKEDDILLRVDFNGLSKYNLVQICVSEKENDKGSIVLSNDVKVYKYNKNLEIVERKLISIFFKNPKIEEEYTCERFKRILKNQLFLEEKPESMDEYVDNIEKIVNKAREQKHGTMIVIADADTVKSELKVLKKQAILIEEMDIDANYIKYLTSIDGAIYLDNHAKCHAVGVILDGIADENMGDSSRGSRYNSAYKYFNKLEGENKQCVIVVISEDGMIDVVPEIYNEESTFTLVQDIIDLIREGEMANENLIKKEKELRSIKYMDYHLYFKIADEFYCKEIYDKAYEYYLFGLGIAENENDFITADYYFKITYSSVKTLPHDPSIEDLEDIKKCIALHSNYISTFKDNSVASIFNNMGVAYSLLYKAEGKNDDNFNKEIECYTHAIELDNNESLYYINRARTYKMLGMYKNSLKDYIESEFINDDNTIINSIKEILDGNPTLINDALNYYNQRVIEVEHNENKKLVKLFEGYPQICNDAKGEAAVSKGTNS